MKQTKVPIHSEKPKYKIILQVVVLYDDDDDETILNCVNMHNRLLYGMNEMRTQFLFTFHHDKYVVSHVGRSRVSYHIIRVVRIAHQHKYKYEL